MNALTAQGPVVWVGDGEAALVAVVGVAGGMVAGDDDV